MGATKETGKRRSGKLVATTQEMVQVPVDILKELLSKVEEVYRFHVDYQRCSCHHKLPVVSAPKFIPGEVIETAEVSAVSVTPPPLPAEKQIIVRRLDLEGATYHDLIPGWETREGHRRLVEKTEAKEISLRDYVYEYACGCGRKCAVSVETVVKEIQGRKDKLLLIQRRNLCSVCNKQARRPVVKTGLAVPLAEMAKHHGKPAAKTLKQQLRDLSAAAHTTALEAHKENTPA